MRRTLGNLMREHLYSIQQPYTMPQPSAPVVASDRGVPITPSERWQLIDKVSIRKRFSFADVQTRNKFLVALLTYEEQVGHSATLNVDEASVDVCVGTRDLQAVTEIDKEYAKYCDVLYRDMTYSLPQHGNQDEL